MLIPLVLAPAADETTERRVWTPRRVATRLLDQFFSFRFGQQRQRVSSAERGDDGSSGSLVGGSSSRTGVKDFRTSSSESNGLDVI